MKCWATMVVLISLVLSDARAGVLARFKMNQDLGTIDVELFEKDKPITVSNFVAYVKSGQWHDTIVQRWHPGFVIQGGRYNLPHRDDLMTPFSADPTTIQTFTNIPFEADSGIRYKNLFGTLSMARASHTNSAGAEWFFNLADNANLDTPPGYTVFGKTLRGTNTLNRFNGSGAATKIYTSSDPIIPQPQGSFIPVYSTNGTTGFWVNLDITLLTVEISPGRGANNIAWNSVENLPNVVEYTTVIPAVWQTLQTVTGTGARMSVADASAGPMRQYRVRIVYPN